MSKKSRLVITLSALVLAVGACVGFYTLTQKGADAPAHHENRHSAIASLLPNGVSKAFFGPGGTEAIQGLARFLPAGAPVGDMGVGVDETAYVEIPANQASGLGRYLLLHFKSEDEADAAGRKVDKTNASGEWVASRQGQVLSIAAADSGEPPALTGGLVDTNGFRLPTTNAPYRAWVDFDAALHGATSDAKKQNAITAGVGALRGLKPGTRWSGSSHDGDRFEGEWVSGGYKGSLVDVNKAQEIFDEDAVTVSGPDGTMQYTSNSLADYLNDAVYGTSDELQAGSLKGDMPAGLPTGERIEVLGVKSYSYYINGAPWRAEGLEYLAWVYRETGATLVLS